jgi:pimeloyl-ACP methyl ester carboxylesterase
VLSGCAANLPIPAQTQQCKAIIDHASSNLNAYSLYINSRGELIDTHKKPVQDTDAYLAAIFQNYNRLINLDSRLRLALYIHGGLNGSKEVAERVGGLWKPMLEDCKYPVFVSWRSGFPSNYWDHLALLRRGVYSSPESFPSSKIDDWAALVEGPLSSPFVLVEDTLRAISRIPARSYHVLVDENRALQQVTSSQESYAKVPKINYHDGATDEGLAFGDVWSIANPIKLLSAPAIDGFGTGAWDSMLRRTDFVLHKDEQFNGDGGLTAVSQFIEKWEQSAYKNREVILIGHSMGSIIANKIIAKYHEIEFSPIVYMAAACSLSDIEQIISPYLSHNPKRVFYNLTLSPTRDKLENFLGIDIVPRGSLLVWIDNIMGSINSFGDRTAGFWPNLTKVTGRIFPEKIRPQVHLTKFGVNDGSPQNHGDFDNFPFWDEQFWLGKRDVMTGSKPN